MKNITFTEPQKIKYHKGTEPTPFEMMEEQEQKSRDNVRDDLEDWFNDEE